MTPVEAMTDPALFGREFGGPTWAAWRVLLRLLFGLPPEGEADLALLRACTGREAWPTSPAREAWIIAGRRAGKSRIAALLAVFLACFRDWREVLAPGERAVVMILATDRGQAGVVFSYVRALLEHPLLAPLVEAERAESIDLRGGASVEVHAASYRSVRGRTLAAAILDEVAFWRDESSTNPDVEVVAALRPALATTGGLLLGISTPYARRGVLWQAFAKHYAKDASPVMVWRAPSRSMNPDLPARLVAAALEEDPAAGAAEWLAEFRSDIEGFVSREAVDAAVEPGRLELPYDTRECYLGFVDPSGGSSDSMTLAVAHLEGPASARRAVLDCVREVRPPFSPEGVVAEFAETLRGYHVNQVTGDRYGAEWVAQSFERAGIRYQASAKSKSELYRELLPALNSKRVDLLDQPRLLGQLVGLERRTARGGRESIDHAPGAHDDVVNAAAGALVLALDGALSGEARVW